MPPTFAHELRVRCVAVALILATACGAAEPTQPSPVGLTQEQVLSRYGEPKSQIAAGNRVVMFFAKDRLVLRDGVVVEHEKLASDVVRRPAPTPPPAATATTAPTAEPSAP